MQNWVRCDGAYKEGKDEEYNMKKELIARNIENRLLS